MTRADERLVVLAEHEEAIREALGDPGALPPGAYYHGYTPGELRELLDEIDRERGELQLRQSRKPATAPRGRASRPGRPAAPVQNRRNTLKLGKLADGIIVAGIVAADVAAVIHVEKGLIAAHDHAKVLIGTGFVFALPALLILLVAWLVHRARAARAAAPAAAPSRVPFSQYGGRR